MSAYLSAKLHRHFYDESHFKLGRDTFTRHDSSVTLIFISAQPTVLTDCTIYCQSDSTSLNCTWVLNYHAFYGRTDFRKATFYVTHIWRMLFIGSDLSTGYSSIGIVQVFRKIQHFIIAGCNQQVVEDIIRSFQCLYVCYWPITHNKHTASPPSRDCFLLLCTIPQTSCNPSLLALQNVTQFTVLPYCSCLLILFLPFEECFTFMLNYTRIIKAQIK